MLSHFNQLYFVVEPIRVEGDTTLEKVRSEWGRRPLIYFFASLLILLLSIEPFS